MLPVSIIQKNLLELKQKVTINNYRNQISFHSKINKKALKSMKWDPEDPLGSPQDLFLGLLWLKSESA